MQCLHRPKVFYQGRHPLTEPILKPRNCAAHLSAAQDRVAPWASPLAGPVRYPVTAARNLHPASCLAGPDTAPREDGMKGYWQGRRPGRTDFHSRQYSSRFAPSYLPDFRQHRLKAPRGATRAGVIAAKRRSSGAPSRIFTKCLLLQLSELGPQTLRVEGDARIKRTVLAIGEDVDGDKIVASHFICF